VLAPASANHQQFHSRHPLTFLAASRTSLRLAQTVTDATRALVQEHKGLLLLHLSREKRHVLYCIGFAGGV
jgi:hypothetical protein